MNTIENTNPLEQQFAKVKSLQAQLTQAVDGIEAMIIGHEENNANSFTNNMDDVESGNLAESKDAITPKKVPGALPDTGGVVIKNAATKHIVKGLGAAEPKSTVGKQPETGGVTIKNAATKEIVKGLGASETKESVGKQPTTGGESVKNAATKDVEKGKGEALKGESKLENPTEVKGIVKNAATKDIEKGKGEALKGESKLENPTEVKGTIKNAATKDIEGTKTGGPETQNIEKQPTTGGNTVKNPATKDMSKVIKKTSDKPEKPKTIKEDLNDNDGTNVALGEEEVKEESSWMSTRAGANGKVFESGEFSHDEENNQVYEAEEDTDEAKEIAEKEEKLNESIKRFKQIINY